MGLRVLRRDEAGWHGVAESQPSVRLIDRLAYELQLVDRVPVPADASVGEVLVGQRPVCIAEEVKRPRGVGGETGHATGCSRLAAWRRQFAEPAPATGGPAVVRWR